MTRSPDAPDENRIAQIPQGTGEGEVVISGLDTGPSAEERQNVTPTDEQARLTPMLPRKEATDEDG